MPQHYANEMPRHALMPFYALPRAALTHVTSLVYRCTLGFRLRRAYDARIDFAHDSILEANIVMSFDDGRLFAMIGRLVEFA